MTSVSDARDKLESNLGDAGDKWRSGIQNPDRDPSEGLNEVDGLDMAGREAEFDSHWENEADTQEAQDALEDSASDAASTWERNWSDASNWVIGE